MKISINRPLVTLKQGLCIFSQKNLDSWQGACYKKYKLARGFHRSGKVKEVVKVTEFLLTMAVIAVVFIAATVLVAVLAGGLMRLKGLFAKRQAEKVKSR